MPSQEENISDMQSESTYEEENMETIYFKYEFDGCETIDEILDNLDRLTKQFELYKQAGYLMRHPVDTGYCHLESPPPYDEGHTPEYKTE